MAYNALNCVKSFKASILDWNKPHPHLKKRKKKEIKKKHYNKLFGKLMLTDAVKIRIFYSYWWQSAQPHRKICSVLRAFTVHIECETLEVIIYTNIDFKARLLIVWRRELSLS